MKYCHPGDAFIERKKDGPAGDTCELYDCDGNKLFAFAPEWTDAQIMKALDFANVAFSAGVRYGRSDKAYEVRKALGMEQ